MLQNFLSDMYEGVQDTWYHNENELELKIKCIAFLNSKSFGLTTFFSSSVSYKFFTFVFSSMYCQLDQLHLPVPRVRLICLHSPPGHLFPSSRLQPIARMATDMRPQTFPDYFFNCLISFQPPVAKHITLIAIKQRKCGINSLFYNILNFLFFPQLSATAS